MAFTLRREHLAAIYVLGVAGAFVQIVGGGWDVASHLVRTPETFFTPQHEVLYAGILLAMAASGLGVLLRWTVHLEPSDRPLLTGLGLSAIGGGIQVVAGPFDFWWHSTYGFDPHLLTPAHTLLISGIFLVGVGMALGSVRLFEAHRQGRAPAGRFATAPTLTLLVVLALSALWLSMNGLLYLLFDADGYAYTFHLGADFLAAAGPAMFLAVTSLLAAPGTLILFTAKRLFSDRRTVAVIPTLVVAVSAAVNVGFRAVYLMGQGDYDGFAFARFLPLYVLFLLPILLFVFLVPQNRPRAVLVGAALVGPFVSYIDGFYSSALWTSPALMADLPILLPAMMLVGLVAAWGRGRFARLLALPPPTQPAAPIGLDRATE